VSDKTWYLGPLGDLRGLVCPDKGISIAEERSGGVHQGLSGARTLDITGHRAKYEMSLSNLDPDEFAWLEALYLGLVPGPYRLINPMKRNRLSHQASTMKTRAGALGLSAPDGTFLGRSTDWPSEVGLTGRSARFTAVVDDRFIFDLGRKTTVFGPGEEIMGSFYVKSDASLDYEIRLTFYDLAGDAAETWFGSYTATPSWSRPSIQMAVPADRFSVVLELCPQAQGVFNVAAPQLEAGTVLTPWGIGGGAPEVVFDQMPTVSPRYPLRTASLTLLET
jgi:hypothetical protein